VSAKTNPTIPLLCAATLALGACSIEDAGADPTPTFQSAVSDVPVRRADNYGYFALRPDPDAGGGLLVRAVNLTTTLCGDGTYAPECHVTALNLKQLGLGEEREKELQVAAAEARVIVRGDLGDQFVASAAWVGAAETSGSGIFARVTSTGIVCVAAPCPSLHAAQLNTKKSSDLGGLDLAATGVSPRQVEGAEETVREKAGLLVAATTYQVTGPAGTMPGYRVNQFYLPVAATAGDPPRPPTDCYVGGCSAELCTDDPGAVSTCIYKPEFECFRSAVCERQPDLRCGWTPTPELEQCLANPPALE
jgi:hypothetical protein